MNPNFPYDKRVAGELLEDPDTFATTLLTILLAAYGEGVMGWDPLEVYAAVKDDFRVVIPEENENRLNAIQLALTTGAFYSDPLAFRAIASALADGDIGDVATGVLEDLTVPEILWAVFEVGLLLENEPELSPQVEAVIQAEVDDEAQDDEILDPEDVLPYHEVGLTRMKIELMSQLQRLGVKAAELAELMDK